MFNYLIVKVIKHVSVFGLILQSELAEITNYVKTKMSLSSGEYKTSLGKKLNYFSENLLACIFKYDIFNKKELYLNVYTNILKFGGHYLRLDSLQVLKNMMENKYLSNMSIDEIESKYYNLAYLLNNVREKNIF
jgi:hypothetical protein